jgi:hypothetical protein
MSPQSGTEHNLENRASTEPSNHLIEVRTESFPPDAVEMSHVKTRKGIAWLIILGVFLIFLIHWGSAMYFALRLSNPLDVLDKVFDMWVPIFTGLLGTAVGFYFADRRR